MNHKRVIPLLELRAGSALKAKMAAKADTRPVEVSAASDEEPTVAAQPQAQYGEERAQVTQPPAKRYDLSSLRARIYDLLRDSGAADDLAHKIEWMPRPEWFSAGIPKNESDKFYTLMSKAGLADEASEIISNLSGKAVSDSSAASGLARLESMARTNPKGVIDELGGVMAAINDERDAGSIDDAQYDALVRRAVVLRKRLASLSATADKRAEAAEARAREVDALKKAKADAAGVKRVLGAKPPGRAASWLTGQSSQMESLVPMFEEWNRRMSDAAAEALTPNSSAAEVARACDGYWVEKEGSTCADMVMKDNEFLYDSQGESAEAWDAYWSVGALFEAYSKIIEVTLRDRLLYDIGGDPAGSGRASGHDMAAARRARIDSRRAESSEKAGVLDTLARSVAGGALRAELRTYFLAEEYPRMKTKAPERPDGRGAPRTAYPWDKGIAQPGFN